jgi:hypothetical protein
MAAIDASTYEELIIESTDGVNSVDVRLGTVAIDYYEDVFSPTITAKVTVVNTGDAVVSAKDGKLKSIYNGLPLRGGERVSMKIAGNSDTNLGLDFATTPKDYLYVSSITNVISEPQREVFTIHLVSREAITNETARVSKKYPTSQAISISVKKIIDEYLKPDKDSDIDITTNEYGFIGNLRKPFSVLTWLASKAVPDITDGTAGFFFYQTYDGFKFRSIDKLISTKPIFEYVYTGANRSGQIENNDLKILSYTTNKNQNLLEKLRLGAYSSFRVGFNPLSGSFTQENQGTFGINSYKDKTKNLGQEIKLPPISNDANVGLGDIPTRIISQLFDVGTVDKGVSLKPNADPFKYQSQSIMRYNLLFTQQLSMTIPLNTNLKAGDIISCKFPENTRDKEKTYDDEQSGLYMIKELCHHFDPDQSLTSMKLVRDTFGLYGTNNQ